MINTYLMKVAVIVLALIFVIKNMKTKSEPTVKGKDHKEQVQKQKRKRLIIQKVQQFHKY